MVKTMRLIDTDKLDDVVLDLNQKGWKITRNDYKRIDSILFEFPTVDPPKELICSVTVDTDEIIERIKERGWGPVEHGRWDLIDGCEPMRYGCSVCHRMVWHYENYCPSCGAKMDEEDEDETD